MRAAVLLGLVLGAVLIAAIVYAANIWLSIQGDGMSGHGMLALALGVGFSLALGMGLMWLVFYSRRSGHDDEVGKH